MSNGGCAEFCGTRLNVAGTFSTSSSRTVIGLNSAQINPLAVDLQFLFRSDGRAFTARDPLFVHPLKPPIGLGRVLGL